MKEKELKNEGLADLAHKVEKDHEVQMARAELYKIGKYAIKLHEMLKGVSEQEGLEGWVQSKITKAGDYLSSVYHHMDYEQKFEQVQTEAKAKPDFLDMDKDGNKKEPMKKAIKDKEAKKDKKESIDYKEELAEELNRVLSKKKTERSLTKGEEKKKEKYVKGMKKAKGDFKDRYGDDAEAVMYATATKMAKKESKDQETDESGIMYRAGVKKYGKDGMKKIQSAAGKGASAEEIGKIKDKHNKKKKESFSSLEESVGKAITEEEFDQLAEKKDACYHKVKSRYKVWPSAYASGALVQCRKKGAKNWGNKSK
jgi:hypothetical protein|tara:strand:+ start:145 stop:1080 length:936 start_codon:yes stop_codon:yes gene_type:complete